MDEECDISLYTEALTRTNETGGIIFTTCTPLLGMSDVMIRFWVGDSRDSKMPDQSKG
jgi:phage terminase large subunit-like protein